MWRVILNEEVKGKLDTWPPVILFVLQQKAKVEKADSHIYIFLTNV